MNTHKEVHGHDNNPDDWLHLALCDAQQRDAEGSFAPDRRQDRCGCGNIPQDLDERQVSCVYGEGVLSKAEGNTNGHAYDIGHEG
jgi:hypothetical protein